MRITPFKSLNSVFAARPAQAQTDPANAETQDSVQLSAPKKGKLGTALHYAVSGAILLGLTAGLATMGSMPPMASIGAWPLIAKGALGGATLGAVINGVRGWRASKNPNPSSLSRLETTAHYAISGATLLGATGAVLGVMACHSAPDTLNHIGYMVAGLTAGSAVGGVGNAVRGWLRSA